MSEIVYFSKMFQAVPHLAQVAQLLPGTFISNRLSTLRAVHALYPQIQTASYSRFFGPFARGNRLLKNAKVIVTGSPYKEFLGPYKAKKCTVFHGTYMLLSKEALERNAHFDLLCVIGPRMQNMINRFADDFRLNTVQTGFLPFCEYPERNDQNKRQILEALGLNPDKQLVVYTPSRRGIGSWDNLAERLLKEVPKNFNLVLRPHPSQALTSRIKDRMSFKRIQNTLATRGDALLDLTSISLPSLLSVADLLVSDANSPTEESLFYDVPHLLVETPMSSRITRQRNALRQGAHPDDVAKLLTLYDCGPTIAADATYPLMSIVEKSIADASKYAEARENYFSWVFGQRDRLADQRVCAAIKRHLLT